MRKLVLVSAFVVACGGSSSSNGGALSGTVGGRAFAPVEVRAITAASALDAPCQVPLGGTGTVPVAIRGLAIDIASYADACGDYASGACLLHANAQNVTVLFAKVSTDLTHQPAFASGSYTIYDSPTTVIPDGTGTGLTVTYARATATGASPGCVPTSSDAVTGGTLRLDTVTGSTITGHVSVTFKDGSSLQGDFSAPVCGAAPDICLLATTQALCTPPATCVP